jgi:hypothetical protein
MGGRKIEGMGKVMNDQANGTHMGILLENLDGRGVCLNFS